MFYFETSTTVQGVQQIPGPKLAESRSAFNSAARYVFRLDSLEIFDVRARTTDTDYASIAVLVGDQPRGKPLAVRMGDVQGGKHRFTGNVGGNPDNSVDTVETSGIDVVPGVDGPLTVAFSVVNYGGPDTPDKGAQIFFEKLSGATAGALEAWTKTDWKGPREFTTMLNDAQFSGCDGAVAFDTVSVASDRLESETAVADLSETRRYHGDDYKSSPVTCWDQSNYKVNWVLRRVRHGNEALDIRPALARVRPGSTASFSAHAADVNWLVVGGGSRGTISNGAYRAPSDLAPGDLIVIRAEERTGRIGQQPRKGVAFVGISGNATLLVRPRRPLPPE